VHEWHAYRVDLADGAVASVPIAVAGHPSEGNSPRVGCGRCDPALWQRQLCDVLGRDLSGDERRGLPPELPDVMGPP
jgi:hypothetical protein